MKDAHWRTLVPLPWFLLQSLAASARADILLFVEIPRKFQLDLSPSSSLVQQLVHSLCPLSIVDIVLPFVMTTCFTFLSHTIPLPA